MYNVITFRFIVNNSSSLLKNAYLCILLDACRENHLNIVKYLIMLQNCDINQLTTTYETCLHGAILGAIKNRFDSSVNNQQRYQIVQYLLARSDCNPNLGMSSLFFV